MIKIKKAKSVSIWIFLLPFIAVNTCLLLINEFQWVFPDQEDIIHNAFPYFDGQASISRTVRPYPSWLIFKPAMFLTSFLLVKYWFYNKDIIIYFNNGHKHLKKIIFFGVGSAIALTIHSIFLGINFDNDMYKLFRRVIMLVFIIFEVAAQAYFVSILYSFKYLHIKHAKTGILDAFFNSYLNEHNNKEFLDWVSNTYSPEKLKLSFKVKKLSEILSTYILRRE